MSDQGDGWFLTAPWDVPAQRRGDALGFRRAADHFADIVAPGLNNSTVDARWVSILAWCLKWSHEAWRRSEGGDLGRREAQARRYAWLRPLELLWVARTLEVQGETARRQLPGRRSVHRWLEDRNSPRFSMTEDRFRRYRQSGAFGAYRTLFRNVVPELTLGKRGGASWSLGPGGSSLARYVNQRLPAAARPSDALFDDGSVRWKCWEGKEEAFWQQRGWQFWDTSGRTPLLPTVLASAETLPDEERDILKSLLFTAGSRRRIVVDYLALCPPVKTHVELCDLIARSTDLLKTPDGADVQLLPAFSRLADAGMDAIRSIWRVVAGDPRGAAIADLVADGALRGALDELGKASKQWLRLPQRSQFIHERVPTTLARDLAAAHSTSKQIRCLLLHHEHHGGGLKWFRLARDRVEARLPQNQLSTSDYRFRLWPLARLAAQCGFSTMRPVIAATVVRRDLETDDEDESP